MKIISTRLPDGLHSALAEEVARRKVESPKFSLNDALIEAVKSWVPSSPMTKGWATGDLKPGDVITVEGEYAVNPPKAEPAPKKISTSDAARRMREQGW